MKNEINEIKQEVEKMQEESFAMSLLKDYKKQNKRLFTIIIVILSMWFITIGYLVYYIGNYASEEVEEYNQEIKNTNTSTVSQNMVK